MVIYLILTLVAFLLFVVYNSVAINLFGVPSSMSKTYYLYEEKKKGLGNLFTAFMWIMALLLLPGWIEIANWVGPWMSYFQFLGFLSAACIAFVGTAPKYYDEMEGHVHMFAAKMCAATAILWDFLVCWNIWYVPIIGGLIAAIIGFCTKTWKTASAYWWEMIAFDATFATIITEQIIQLSK